MASIRSYLSGLFQTEKSDKEQFEDDFIYFWDDIPEEEYISSDRKSLRESLSENLVLVLHAIIFVFLIPLLIIVGSVDILIATLLGLIIIGSLSLSYLQVRNKYIDPSRVLDENIQLLEKHELTGSDELFYLKESTPILANYDSFRMSIISLLQSLSKNTIKLYKELELTQSMNLSVYRAIDQINLSIENRLSSVANYQETKGYLNQVSLGIDHFTDNFDRTLNTISEVTSILSSIGKQTTMLALNAGIEAAKSGERGRGFEVVASNLRRLAQHAIDSSHRINSITDDISNRAKLSLEEMTLGMNSLSQMIDMNHDNITTLNDDLFTTIRDLDDVGKELVKMEEYLGSTQTELNKFKY